MRSPVLIIAIVTGELKMLRAAIRSKVEEGFGNRSEEFETSLASSSFLCLLIIMNFQDCWLCADGALFAASRIVKIISSGTSLSMKFLTLLLAKMLLIVSFMAAIVFLCRRIRHDSRIGKTTQSACLKLYQAAKTRIEGGCPTCSRGNLYRRTLIFKGGSLNSPSLSGTSCICGWFLSKPDIPAAAFAGTWCSYAKGR